MNLFQRIRKRRKQKHLAAEAAVHASQTLSRAERLQAAQWLQQCKLDALARNPLLAYGRQVYSQNDEDGIIEEIWRRIGGGEPGCFVEFGVGDGIENNTLHLLARGWRGSWLGGEAIRIRWQGSRLRFRQSWITSDNVVSLVKEELQSLGSERLDLLSIDLDGNDWHLWRNVLTAGIRPAILVAEYNPLLPPPVQWVMPYDAQHTWQGDDWYGASLGAMHALMHVHGYRLVGCNLIGVNAFFVREDFADRFPEAPDDWSSMYMAAAYFPYPWLGHPRAIRTIESLIV